VFNFLEFFLLLNHLLEILLIPFEDMIYESKGGRCASKIMSSNEKDSEIFEGPLTQNSCPRNVGGMDEPGRKTLYY
jgi:hypothetical protein